jgi:Flp pilus assembly protein TadG
MKALQTRFHLKRSSILAMRSFLKAEEGSATLEFVMLAIPLFVPLALFLVSVNGASSLSFDARNMSRQVARAFVTGSDQLNAQARVNSVENSFQSEIFIGNDADVTPSIDISCNSNPCLTPGGEVMVTVTLNKPGRGGVARARTVETVDVWRSP